MLKPGEPCKFEGCQAKTRGTSGFCSVHVHIAYQCVVRDCQNRVASHSRSRCCNVHRLEGVRIRNKKRLAWSA